MSARVCVGSRHVLKYKTLGVAYGRYLSSRLYRHPCCDHRVLPPFTHCCYCRCPFTAVVYSLLLLPQCTPLLPPSIHCCRLLTAAVYTATAAVHSPLLLPCTLLLLPPCMLLPPTHPTCRPPTTTATVAIYSP